MGRTNATYRNHLDAFIESFSPFRRALREGNREFLDSLWEKAHQHAHAAAYMNPEKPALPAVVSAMLGVQREVSRNEDRIEELEERVRRLEDGLQD
ncbi:MAG: hypothetical protein ABEJ03_04980 [Candidatus Nanohaloarchaea archaeon]